MKRMSRRHFMAASAASAAMVGLGGCGGTESASDVVTSSRELNVLNWSDYLDPNLLSAFDSIQTDFSTTYSETWEDNFSGQDLFGPSWDIVTPTNWLAAQYIEEGRVQRLPIEFIPNHSRINPVFLTNDWDRGARFHMPWQSGITGIAYDMELTGRELTSVNDLLADDLAGQVAMIGEMREAVGLIMLANGDDPGRPETEEAERAFEQILAANEAGQFHSWVFNEFTDLLASRQVAASMAWSGDAIGLQLEQPDRDIRFVIPDEGAIQWFDTMVIPNGARNVRGAAEWMNHFYEVSTAAANTQWGNFISPVLGVQDELRSRGGAAAELASNPILFPDGETQRRLFIWGGLESTNAERDLDDRFAERLL